MRAGIVGLGLIGGSFAKAYSEAGHEVLAFDRNESVLSFAQIEGAVSAPLTKENIGTCDIVLVAIYPEAVIDLIDAETADAAANAAGQVAGAIRKRIDPIYDSWVDLCAHFHAVLDYPDEDIDPFMLSGYEASLTASSRQLTALLASCHRGRMVQSGIRAVILGSPNAGKSSLLNRLSGFDRVIVTDIPGTFLCLPVCPAGRHGGHPRHAGCDRKNRR